MGQYPQLYPTSFSGQPIFEQAQTAAGPAIVKYNPVPSPIVQHHAQNIYGAADYGYSHPGQFHEAMRDIYGGVTGTYAYLDPEGKEVRVEYVADDQGFRVKTNGLPQGPVGVVPTEEVRRATEEHLRLVAETQKDVSRTKRHSTGYPHSHHIMTPHVVQSRRPTITYIPSSPYHHGPVYKSHPIYVNPQRYPVPHAYNFPHRLPYYHRVHTHQHTTIRCMVTQAPTPGRCIFSSHRFITSDHTRQCLLTNMCHYRKLCRRTNSSLRRKQRRR